MSPPTRRLAELSDRALALRAQDGDPDAFDVLIDRHQGRLFRIAYLVLGDRQDSEDVVQETLLTAWKRLHLSLIHISEPTRRLRGSRMPSSA